MLPKIALFKGPNNGEVSTKYEFKLNFDGGSRGNPGIAGAGAVLYHNDEEIWCQSSFLGKKVTNNQAEYAGLIFGLQQAKHLNIKHLKVEGDSLLVINQMKSLFKCRSENLNDLYEQAKELSSWFTKIEFYHILRNHNKRADELANIAMNQYLSHA